MIDPKTEELLTLSEAIKLPELKRNGRPINKATAWRWISAGKLEVLKVGGVTLTSRESVNRMIAAANPGTVPTVSFRERQMQVGAAERRLAACGV